MYVNSFSPGKSFSPDEIWIVQTLQEVQHVFNKRSQMHSLLRITVTADLRIKSSREIITLN